MIRRVIHTDLIALARVLLTRAPGERAEVVAQALEETQKAARYRRGTGLAHPEFGDGTLEGWAGKRRRVPEPWVEDPDYADCLILILKHWAHGAVHPLAQDTQRVAARSSLSRPAGMSSSQSSQMP